MNISSHHLWLILIAILLLVISTGFAISCPELAEVQERLRLYSPQEPMFRGLILDGEAIFELWVSDHEWASVIITPDGTACVVDQGDYWELLTQEGDPA